MAGTRPDLGAQAALDPLDSRYIDIGSLPWEEPRPGLRMKVLYKDNAARQATILFEAEPGTVLPEHIHTGVEQTLVLEGSLEDEHGACTAGNFVWRPAGSRHTARCPDGARFVVFFQNAAKQVDTGRLFPSYED